MDCDLFLGFCCGTLTVDLVIACHDNFGAEVSCLLLSRYSWHGWLMVISWCVKLQWWYSNNLSLSTRACSRQTLGSIHASVCPCLCVYVCASALCKAISRLILLLMLCTCWALADRLTAGLFVPSIGIKVCYNNIFLFL